MSDQSQFDAQLAQLRADVTADLGALPASMHERWVEAQRT